MHTFGSSFFTQVRSWGLKHSLKHASKQLDTFSPRVDSEQLFNLACVYLQRG